MSGDYSGMVCADELCLGDQICKSKLLRLGPNLMFVADEQRRGNSELQSAVGRGKRNFIIRTDDRNSLRSQRLRAMAELREICDNLSSR